VTEHIPNSTLNFIPGTSTLKFTTMATATALNFYNGNRAVTIVIVALFSLIIICVTKIIRHLRDPLRNVPGPFWARYTRLWYLIEMLNCHSRDTIAKLHEEYGRIDPPSPGS
jgi:hypothetical protein